MKISMLAVTGIIATVLMSGCAVRDMEKKHSGFLKSYDKMEESKKFEGSIVRVIPGADFSKYDSIMVVPVEILSNVEEDAKTPKQKELYTQISDYLTTAYRDAVKDGPNFNLVDTAGPKTLKVEVAISAVEVHYDDMEWYQFTPITLGMTVIARGTYVDGAVRILAEARISDSETGDVLLRSMNLQEGEEVKTDADHLSFEDVKPALDAWKKRSKKQLPNLKKLIAKQQK